MPGEPSSQAYLRLAEQLIDGHIAESELSTAVGHLNLLDETLLHQLAQLSEDAAPTQPHHAWAITAVTDAAAVEQDTSLFQQSLAAWYLGRAANQWVQPQRVASAIGRARQGFEKLQESSWLAACDWQANLLSWTKPNIAHAARTLQEALEGLQRAELDEFIPHCRLSLAYAQILTNQFDAAQENIQTSETLFIAQGDTVNQARCWWTEASLFRRQSRFDQALDTLNQSLRVFQYNGLPVDIAKTYYQFALIHILQTDNLSVAIADFHKAEIIFQECNLDLWLAAIKTYLGSVHLQNGRFGLADECFQQARTSFTHHNVLGLLADNLNDSGKLNARRGLHNLCLKQYQQAKELNDKLGSKIQAAIALFNLGETYGQLGRYQDALHYLEQATQQLLTFKDHLRLGTCERYIASIWLRLGELSLALEHLDSAAENYRVAGQKAFFASIQHFRAGIFYQQGLFAESIDWLEKSLATAEKYDIPSQAALAQRLLGEALLRTEQYSRAKLNLEGALSKFSAMGMMMEEAASLVALGSFYLETSADDQAVTAFEQALSLSQGDFPEVDWRAQAGLAHLAEMRGDASSAIHACQQGVEALVKIRHNFWQPALAGSYLHTPAIFFDNAILLAAKNDKAEDALYFIESSKATTLLQQLATNSSGRAKHSHALDNLRGEINWLQEQLRASFEQSNPLQFAIQSRQLRSRLAESTRQYDALLAQLERQEISNPEAPGLPSYFNLPSFRATAKQMLGSSWLALDYYLTESHLITVSISPEICEVHTAPFTSRIRMALDSCQRAWHQENAALPRDLEILGEWLIPPAIAKYLSLEPLILLVPHRGLHGIPWGALQPGATDQPLVWQCAPSVTPSLQSLIALWMRAASGSTPPSEPGLVIGLSKTPNAKEELPYVRDEIAALQNTQDPGVQFLQYRKSHY